MNNFSVYKGLRPYKILIACLIISGLVGSCSRKPEIQETLLDKCDELNIVYYTKDSFVFKDFDTASIKKYIELITFENDASIPVWEVTGRLIFKQKGQQLFAADISTDRTRDNRCNMVRYQLKSKEYKHLLTYRTGMGMNEIYWHKMDPQGNPWTGLDTSKFYYEDLKNTR